VAGVALRHLPDGVAGEDLVPQASQPGDDRFVELRQRLVPVGLGQRAWLSGLLDPQEDVAHELDRRRRQMQDQRLGRVVVRHRPGIAGDGGADESGRSPDRGEEVGRECGVQISSRATYLIEVPAGESGSTTLNMAYSYGGIVECSTSMAHWKWRRRLATSVIGVIISTESSRLGPPMCNRRCRRLRSGRELPPHLTQTALPRASACSVMARRRIARGSTATAPSKPSPR
jgi:hypothetical protein